MEARFIRKLNKEEEETTRFWIPRVGREKKYYRMDRLRTHLQTAQNWSPSKKARQRNLAESAADS